ncbi:MAG: cytochrome b N-terminal domain-containing protein [Verrucomicrobiales bacterium]
MNKVLDWLDHRTGYRKLTREVLIEPIPGGARWRYIWGSTLSFAVIVQFITGIFLWMGYSPSAQTAWESVYFIQEKMPAGWLLRGIHHYTAQLMVPLLVLHLMQVVIDGAYKAPREVNYFFGIGLLLLVLALSLTGYLLPWDQKGYWATKVATNLVAGVPLIGSSLQRIIVGGSDYGHHTLTRFMALHAGVLPGLLVALIGAHLYLFRRHGITPRKPFKRPDGFFWPDQILKESVACLAILAAVLVLVIRHHGSDLGAPANPSEPFSSARPDWYFMFFFQFLKDFPAFAHHFLPPLPGGVELWGSILLPGLVLGIVTLMPLWSRWRVGHYFNVALLFSLLVGFGWFTWRGFAADWRDASYQVASAQANKEAARAKELARYGIPPEGALALLKNDPMTQGPKLFAAKCASCHSFDGHNGLGLALSEKQSAADLKGFGSREWLRGFLDPAQHITERYWGGTAFVKPPEGKRQSKMTRTITEDIAAYTPEQKQQLEKVIAALSAEAKLESQRDIDAKEAVLIEEGSKLMGVDALNCIECHKWREEVEGKPDLNGWASRQWTLDFLKNPAHDRFYGIRNDRMPAYGEKGELAPRQMEMLVDWMRGEVK